MVEVKCGTVFIDFFELKTNLRGYPLAVVSVAVFLLCSISAKNDFLSSATEAMFRLLLRGFS
jgi:hypothetical protein